MGWIRYVRCEKLQRDFVGRTFVLIAPVQYVLHQLSCTYETIPNAPKYYELHRNISLGSKGVDWVRSLKKSKRGIVARTFALIAPVQYVLQQVSCSYETIPNAPKYYETDWNISSGSNWVDQVHWLQKITTWLHGTDFCINWTGSICFAPRFMQLRNVSKFSQILHNSPKR